MNLTLADIESTAPETAWRRVASFRVLGEPKAQPRPRAFARAFGGRPTARMYTPGTAEAWKGDIALAARQHIPVTPIPKGVAVRLDAVILFDRPARLMRKSSPAGRIWHTAKPDRDNLDKAIMDCLTTLGMWDDDAQVCAGGVTKFYRALNERPGAIITVYVEETLGFDAMGGGK